MPRFLVKRTFEISARQLFILAGEIIEGEIAPNMCVNVPFNSGLSTTLQISSIEFARYEGGEDVCLCVQSTEDEAEILQALNLGGEILEVEIEGPTKT